MDPVTRFLTAVAVAVVVGLPPFKATVTPPLYPDPALFTTIVLITPVVVAVAVAFEFSAYNKSLRKLSTINPVSLPHST